MGSNIKVIGEQNIPGDGSILKNQVINLLESSKHELIEFARDLVRIKSYSGHEEEAIKFIAAKMENLGYDQVNIDSMGNVTGRIGSGEKSIMFDSHIDTVEVKDENEWEHPPFSGKIENGYLHGLGAVDMKAAAAASIYAAAAAKKLALDAGKTIYVTCTVQEEDCDGENLKHLFKELAIKPDYFITCEPSGNKIVTGHKGKAQVSIKTRGISAHGSAPEKGSNAIYEMADIISRVERANRELQKKEGLKRTLVMSQITSQSVSLNAVPFECEAHLDRRTVPGESEADIKTEMDRLVEGKDADWNIYEIRRKSWTGMKVFYRPFHLAWEIDSTHELSGFCRQAYQEYFNSKPKYDYWDFSTNAVTPVSMGIPTIGFGPGEYKLAHCRNEKCAVKEIFDAAAFYTLLIDKITAGLD